MAHLLNEEARGKRTLVQVLDAWADERPEKIYASLLNDVNVAHGFRDITTKQMRGAADAFAHWLVDTYGTSTSHETIAYIGLHDLRYAMVFFGCIKAGYKV